MKTSLIRDTLIVFVDFGRAFNLTGTEQADQLADLMGEEYMVSNINTDENRISITSETLPFRLAVYTESLLLFTSFTGIDDEEDEKRLKKSRTLLAKILKSKLLADSYSSFTLNIDAFYIPAPTPKDLKAEAAARIIASKISSIAQFEDFSVDINVKEGLASVDTNYEIVKNTNDEYGFKININYRDRVFIQQQKLYSADEVIKHAAEQDMFKRLDDERANLESSLA